MPHPVTICKSHRVDILKVIIYLIAMNLICEVYATNRLYMLLL